MHCALLSYLPGIMFSRPECYTYQWTKVYDLWLPFYVFRHIHMEQLTRLIFMKFYIWWFFENLLRKSGILKCDKNNGYSVWRPMYMYVPQFVLEWYVLWTKVVEKKCILHFNNFFWNSCCLWDNVGKCSKARQATDDNIIWCRKYAICMLND